MLCGKSWDVRGQGRRECCQRALLVERLDGRVGPDSGKGEAVSEGFDLIDVTCSVELFAALSEAGEIGYVAADDVFEIDLRPGVILVADDDGGAADVLKAGVFYPELVCIAGVD